MNTSWDVQEPGVKEPKPDRLWSCISPSATAQGQACSAVKPPKSSVLTAAVTHSPQLVALSPAEHALLFNGLDVVTQEEESVGDVSQATG